MRKKMMGTLFVLCAVSLIPFLSSATDTTSPGIGAGLAPEILARFNDSFDALREDIWVKSIYLPRVDKSGANFQPADVRVEGGRVKVETRTGCFSTGGLGAKYRFRGDFDIQVDCYVDFLNGVQDMDQEMVLYATNRTREMKDEEIESLYLGVQKPGKAPAFLYCGYLEKGKSHPTIVNKIADRFQGTLRIVRIGTQVTMMHRAAGQGEWQEGCAFTRPNSEMGFALRGSNFAARRTAIGARAPFIGWFDNFRINAAQEILGAEIPVDTALLRIGNSLPPEKLARFNDPFDSFREDLWEKTGFIYQAGVRTDFKQADLRAEGGRLNVVTKTGAFSRSGPGSKFSFRGDFDVQVDVQADFMEDIQDMDQVVFLNALDKSHELEDEKLEFVMIGASKEAGKPAILYSGYQEKGAWTGTNRIEINRFRGTFRVIRIGKNFTTLYRNEGESEWRRLGTVPRTTNDILIVFGATNFAASRTSVGATKSFTATFDNFRINAAQNIMESEI